MTKFFEQSKFRPPQRYEERNGRVEKSDEGKNEPEFRQDGQKDGLALHCKNPRMSHAPKVSSTTTQII